MIRALLCLAAIAARPIGATADAEPKPTVAVVEVDAKEIRAAKGAAQLTTTLRKYAAAKSGAYQPKGTAKELAAAVAKADCKPIAQACAATVGATLGVDYVLASELDVRSQTYVLVLSLVNVRTKQRVRSLRESVATTSDLDKWARRTYERLVDPTSGELTIIANVKQGEILLDGLQAGALWEGRATISGLALGSHELAIRAKGYKPLAVEIRVDGNTTETVLLEPGH